MKPVRVSFIISDLNEDDVSLLKRNYAVVSKMILTPDDFRLFHYKEGDNIQVETQDGNRLWCRIESLEKVQHPEHVIIIFTLVRAPDTPPSG